MASQLRWPFSMETFYRTYGLTDDSSNPNLSSSQLNTKPSQHVRQDPAHRTLRWPFSMSVFYATHGLNRDSRDVDVPKAAEVLPIVKHDDKLEVPLIVTPADIVIAVMGVTGSGKTTFVNHLSDYPLSISHSLNSCTQDVQIVPCTLESGERIFLVDTPGFDDDTRSDSEILREVVTWLNRAHKFKLKLSGIIYLQRITDVRIGGSGIRNIKIFKKLCGDDALGSVVLATTFWSYCPDPQQASDREKQFMEQDYLWRPMIEQGSKVFRHDQEKTSALRIVQYLMERKRPVILEIQREMVEQDLPLASTAAGAVISSGLDKEKEHLAKRLRDLNVNLKGALASSDQSQREDIEDMMAEFQRKLEQREQDQKRLEADTHQLYKDLQQRYEDEMKEASKAIHEKELAIQEARLQLMVMEETNSQQLELQKLQMQMMMKKKYYKMMHESTCAVM